MEIGVFYITIKTHVFYSLPIKNGSIKISGIWILLLAFLCIGIIATGCTSSNEPAVTVSGSSESASVTTAAPTALATPPCLNKLVWDGAWDSRELAWQVTTTLARHG
jgi:hypothetical protein